VWTGGGVVVLEWLVVLFDEDLEVVWFQLGTLEVVDQVWMGEVPVPEWLVGTVAELFENIQEVFDEVTAVVLLRYGALEVLWTGVWVVVVPLSGVGTRLAEHILVV